jgi:hypothetical protein
MPCIQVEKKEKPIKAYSGELDHELELKHQEMIDNYRIKLRNSRIITAFLGIIIIIMILISIFSDRSVFSNYEDQILNKYSSWEEDLNTRQKALDDREKALEEREAADSAD